MTQVESLISVYLRIHKLFSVYFVIFFFFYFWYRLYRSSHCTFHTGFYVSLLLLSTFSLISFKIWQDFWTLIKDILFISRSTVGHFSFEFTLGLFSPALVRTTIEFFGAWYLGYRQELSLQTCVFWMEKRNVGISLGHKKKVV